MQEDEFSKWLSKNYSERTLSSRMSNCRRVEQYEGNLDVHYDNDKGRSLISRLSYSAEDKKENRPPKHKIPINGDRYNGTATLKQASKLYFEFKKDAPSDPQKTENQKIKDDDKKPVIDFSKTAKEMAKQITGGNIKFIEFIDNTPLDQHFDRMIKQKLSQLLKRIMGQRAERLTLCQLIDVAYQENSLSKEVKAFAHTIRILRNIGEYEDSDPNLEICHNLIILYAIAGIWRYLQGNE